MTTKEMKLIEMLMDVNGEGDHEYGLCMFCGADMSWKEPHKPDCSYLKYVLNGVQTTRE